MSGREPPRKRSKSTRSTVRDSPGASTAPEAPLTALMAQLLPAVTQGVIKTLTDSGLLSPTIAPPPATPGMASSAEKVTEPLVTASATCSAREPGNMPSVSAPTSAPEILDRPVDIPRSVVPAAVGCSLGGPHNLSAISMATEAEGEGTATPAIRSPPENYRFNKLLLDISKSMTEKELDQIKFLFRGEGGIQKVVKEKITTPLEFFDFMRESDFIGRYNLIYLMSILMILEKPKLIKEAVQYAREVGDTIYFYPPSTSEPDGYTHVKFHVAGKDFKTFKRPDLERLRTELSTILFLSPEHIAFRGIEPASSLLITVMIPSQYANILKSLASQKGRLDNLSAIGIDTFTIGEEPFHIEGSTSTDTTETEQQIRMEKLYNQLENTKRLQDERYVDVLQLKQQKRERQRVHAISKLLQMCDLSSEEIEQLKGQYQWSEEDGQDVKLHDRSFLFQLLHTKEMKQKGQVPFADYVLKCFELLGRKDLTRHVTEECEHLETSLKPEGVQLPTDNEARVDQKLKIVLDKSDVWETAIATRNSNGINGQSYLNDHEGISMDTKFG